MTQEEINDYNRRCAEFLSWEQYDDIDERFYGHWKPNTTLDKPWGIRVERLFFDSEWSWIHEVIEAIEKLGYQFDITGNEVGVNSNIMSMENISTGGTMNSYNRSYYPTIISICEEEYSKKEAVVQAINQFLIWYKNEKIHSN